MVLTVPEVRPIAPRSCVSSRSSLFFPSIPSHPIPSHSHPKLHLNLNLISPHLNPSTRIQSHMYHYHTQSPTKYYTVLWSSLGTPQRFFSQELPPTSAGCFTRFNSSQVTVRFLEDSYLIRTSQYPTPSFKRRHIRFSSHNYLPLFHVSSTSCILHSARAGAMSYYVLPLLRLLVLYKLTPDV